jgi:HAMP domain-containing protein
LFKDVTRAIRVLDRDLAAAENTAASHADGTRLHALEFGIGFAVAVALAFVFVRVAATAWLVRPINTLAEHMRMADAVDDIPASGGPAELRALAQSSEGLRDRLHDELAQAARTRSMLGQHSDALMALRARTHLAARTLPPGWDMCADLVPATGIVAADGYDVTCIGTTMTVLLVEAAEHGVDAAAAGLRAKELVRAALRTHTDVGGAIAWASELMPDAMKLGVTVLVARLDCNNGELSFASAGHPEALLCDGLRVELLSETGPLFGTRNGTWTTRKLTVQPGQIFIAFTDGLLAGRTDSRARFGPERLGQVVHDNYGDSCEGIVKQVLIEAGAFVPGRCHDDIAVAVVARAMPM